VDAHDLVEYPKVGTLASRALALLLTGERITHASFQACAGSYRLSGYIFELRDAGWPIVTIEREKPTTDRKRRSAIYAEYHLPSESISASGERGQRFVASVQRWESGVTAGAVGAAAAVEMANTIAQTDVESIPERGA
jgi:hypothetical protein